MNFSRIFHTIRFLKPIQIIYQIKNRLFRSQYNELSYTGIPLFKKRVVTPIASFEILNGQTFTFLNISEKFKTWDSVDNGMLWTYNLNYMDWLMQNNLSESEGNTWIDCFISTSMQNKVGMDPYPTALRCINWVKFFYKFPQSVTLQHLNSLYSQMCHLSDHLEYHLLANHLLEDALSLYITASFLNDQNYLTKAKKLVIRELNEQILDDGSHFEQSPMYHSIILGRLLDCINYGTNGYAIFGNYARKMLGHLSSIVWEDGTIPLLNDSAYNIAYTPNDLFDYANRLNVRWKPIPLSNCGYRKLSNSIFSCIVDMGGIMASYQPGHSHADTFNYELRYNGLPLVVDTGVSTYNKTERRNYERSSAAHNVVTINNENSSDVWSGFRVGNRVKVYSINETERNIEGCYYSPSNKYCRQVSISDEYFSIVETIEDSKSGISRIHLAPNVLSIAINNNIISLSNGLYISIEGMNSFEIVPTQISFEYNKFEDNQTIEIYFSHSVKYTFHK